MLERSELVGGGVEGDDQPTTEARRVAVAFGKNDIRKGYTMLITMGVAFVNLLLHVELQRHGPLRVQGRRQAAVGVRRERGEVAPDVARVPGLVLLDERAEDALGRNVAFDLDQQVDEDLRRALHARLDRVHEGARDVVLLGLGAGAARQERVVVAREVVLLVPS